MFFEYRVNDFASTLHLYLSLEFLLLQARCLFKLKHRLSFLHWLFPLARLQARVYILKHLLNFI